MSATITVRVRPRSRHTIVETGPKGVAEGSRGVVTVRVRAATEGGRATAEAAAALAEAFGLPKTAVTLRTGARSRTKVFALEGIEAEELERRLRTL